LSYGRIRVPVYLGVRGDRQNCTTCTPVLEPIISPNETRGRGA